MYNAIVNYKKNNWDLTAWAFYSYYGGDHFGEVIWARFAGTSELGDRYYAGNGDKNECTLFSKASWQLNEQWSFLETFKDDF
ncbi:MAG: hypothetical protein R2793_02595 [Flavobacteriaceae bacterium]